MDQKLKAGYWQEKLHLEQHPEGGAFKEVYRSAIGLKAFENVERNLSTSIYYLLREGEFSAFHRIKSDEIWHHYDGGDLLIYVLDPLRGMQILRLGKNHPEALPQQLVPAGLWFASKPDLGAGFVLAGCTVAPGFDFNDFEMAQKDELLSEFEAYKDVIVELTL